MDQDYFQERKTDQQGNRVRDVEPEQTKEQPDEEELHPAHSILDGGLKREKTEVEFYEEPPKPKRRMSIYDPEEKTKTEVGEFKPAGKVPNPFFYTLPAVKFARPLRNRAALQEIKPPLPALPSIAVPAEPKPRRKKSKGNKKGTPRTTRKGWPMLVGAIIGVTGVCLFIVGMALLWLGHEEYFSNLKKDGSMIAGPILMAMGILLFVGGCVLYHVIFKMLYNRRNRNAEDDDTRPVMAPVKSDDEGPFKKSLDQRKRQQGNILNLPGIGSMPRTGKLPPLPPPEPSSSPRKHRKPKILPVGERPQWKNYGK